MSPERSSLIAIKQMIIIRNNYYLSPAGNPQMTKLMQGCANNQPINKFYTDEECKIAIMLNCHKKWLRDFILMKTGFFSI